MGKRIENWKCGAGMDVLRLKSISRDSRLLYAILCGYKRKQSQHPFPSEETLAEDLGCTKRTVSRLKSELKSAGLISWDSRPGSSNIYTINDGGIATSDKGGIDIDGQGSRDTAFKGVGTEMSNEWKPTNENHLMITLLMVTILATVAILRQ
jgi:Helix-turn-helix domain